MLGALKAYFNRRRDGAADAPPQAVNAVAASFEEVTDPADVGERLRRVYALPPETAEILRQIGMPEEIARTAFLAEPEYAMPLRAADEPRVAARRFLVWARAMDWKGTFRSEEVWDEYENFCAYDHRHPVQLNLFCNALADCPGVRKKRVRLPNGDRDPRWTYFVKPRPFSKALGVAIKAPATEPVSNVVPIRRAA